MKNFGISKRESKFSFALIAVLVLVTTGLLLVVNGPQIASYRSRVVDSLLAKAQASNNTSQQYSYLQAAHELASSDPAAIEALARYYRQSGNELAVLDLYERSIAQPNQIYLGNLALSLQQYDAALSHFFIATRQQQSAASLSGQATVLFNLGRVDEGCAKADQAHKLDLGNAAANGAVQACTILRANKDGSDRQAAETLLQNGVAKVGEKWLLSSSTKTPNDWLSLARLAAARGDSKLAISRGEEGIKLDPANPELNRALAQYYGFIGNNAQAQKYQLLYDQLKFANYQ